MTLDRLIRGICISGGLLLAGNIAVSGEPAKPFFAEEKTSMVKLYVEHFNDYIDRVKKEYKELLEEKDGAKARKKAEELGLDKKISALFREEYYKRFLDKDKAFAPAKEMGMIEGISFLNSVYMKEGAYLNIGLMPTNLGIIPYPELFLEYEETEKKTEVFSHSFTYKHIVLKKSAMHSFDDEPQGASTTIGGIVTHNLSSYERLYEKLKSGKLTPESEKYVKRAYGSMTKEQFLEAIVDEADCHESTHALLYSLMGPPSDLTRIKGARGARICRNRLEFEEYSALLHQLKNNKSVDSMRIFFIRQEKSAAYAGPIAKLLKEINCKNVDEFCALDDEEIRRRATGPYLSHAITICKMELFKKDILKECKARYDDSKITLVDDQEGVLFYTNPDGRIMLSGFTYTLKKKSLFSEDE